MGIVLSDPLVRGRPRMRYDSLLPGLCYMQGRSFDVVGSANYLLEAVEWKGFERRDGVSNDGTRMIVESIARQRNVEDGTKISTATLLLSH